MKAAALVLALLLAFVSPALAAFKLPLQSIQPLADIHEDGVVHEMCTAWAVRLDGVTKWVTAGHCVVLNDDKSLNTKAKYTIGGKEASLERFSTNLDLALFKGPSAPGLALAVGNAELGQEVYSFGYFWSTGVFTKGYVSLPDRKTGAAIFNLTAGPGASGAPVLTMDNMVVGAIQLGPCPYSCPVSGGATTNILRAFLQLTP